MALHNLIGQQGEQAAIQFLVNKGYLILDRNIHLRGIEIDIIAEDEQNIIFVEVKTRTKNIVRLDQLFPKHQRSRIIKAADFYVRMKQIDKDVRFDIILVSNTPKGFIIEHIENAFSPIGNQRNW